MARVDKHFGSGAPGTAVEKSPDLAELEQALSDAVTPELFGAKLSKLFRVRGTEVALMRLDKGQLTFLFPPELRTAGSIPVSSSSAVAVRTAVTKKTELFNNFVKVKHISIFETVKLGAPESLDLSEKASIQKLISAPVLHRNKVIGVIQICRKGFDLGSVGPDFSSSDLQQLEAVAKIVSKMPFLNNDSPEQ
ncbi:MAG: hypothetical protein NVS1B11_29650 [Terriglobales bacterium]